jgi:hypothetical protein
MLAVVELLFLPKAESLDDNHGYRFCGSDDPGTWAFGSQACSWALPW